MTNPTTATDVRPGCVIISTEGRREARFTVEEITTRPFHGALIYTFHGYRDIYGALSGPYALSLWSDEVVDVEVR